MKSERFWLCTNIKRSWRSFEIQRWCVETSLSRVAQRCLMLDARDVARTCTSCGTCSWRSLAWAKNPWNIIEPKFSTFSRRRLVSWMIPFLRFHVSMSKMNQNDRTKIIEPKGSVELFRRRTFCLQSSMRLAAGLDPCCFFFSNGRWTAAVRLPRIAG